ncbi:PfkB family carbohydrate kinase [Kitasatospora sp. LaBMicrA B282]|uniref:PfkB family carbohydrate kinase n=1 Tax=Kitasatospora sp. LaBMicrA B282 TaxID=3420949 RepID=UPI003D123C10
MPQFLVIGESVADIVRAPGLPDVWHPGGSPANVAYGLARLGHRTALLTELGADPAGELISAHLRGAGVTLAATAAAEPLRTPTALVSLDAAGRADYSFDIHWSLPQVPAPGPAGDAAHLHFGSIAALLAPGAAATLDLVARRRAVATVSYDPNIRPGLLEELGADPAEVRARVRARVERCVALSDLVKASDEDLDWLYPGRPAAESAAHWHALGPALVLVTHGAEGAAGRSGAARAAVPARPAQVVDTVGAGDSFMAAVLDALAARGLLGAPARPGLGSLDVPALTAVLEHAVAAAAVTVSRAGANPPTAAELSRVAAG